MFVRYQWSEDGEYELCELTKTKAEKDSRCNFCDGAITKSENIATLKSLLDNDRPIIYKLHEECAKKSCTRVEF